MTDQTQQPKAVKGRIYKVTDKLGKMATMVRASSQAQAVNHVVRGVYKARVATVEDVVEYMTDTHNAAIEDVGEEREE